MIFLYLLSVVLYAWAAYLLVKKECDTVTWLGLIGLVVVGLMPAFNVVFTLAFLGIVNGDKVAFKVKK
jgi:hypothetical protein